MMGEEMMETKKQGEAALPYKGKGLVDINSSHDINVCWACAL